MILGELRNGNYFINLLVLAAAVVSLLLSIKHIYSVSRLYMTARFRYQGIQKKKDNPKFKKKMAKDKQMLLDTSTPEIKMKKFLDLNTPWEKLPVFQRLQFFNFWIILGALGNCLQIVGSISVCLSFKRNVGQEILSRDNIFVGFGCFFAWIQIMYYFQYSKDIILLTSTFRKSSTENLVFYGFVAPLFMGSIFLARSLYYNYDKFETTEKTIISLISMACGCIVHDVFHETYDAGIMRQIFLFFYFFAFYTSIQNIFVSIIMEGYDRCTVRKEIDNDSSFPIFESLKRKQKKKQTPPPLLKLERSHTEPPSSFSMIGDDNTPRATHSSDFIEVHSPINNKQKENLNHCLNELYYKKEQIYILLLELRQAYAEIDEIPFGQDDVAYLEYLYTESLNKILIRIQRDQTMVDLKKYSFQGIRPQNSN